MKHCNATVDEMYKWRQGLYPKWFMAEIVTFARMDAEVDTHMSDANYKPPKKASKKGRG